MRRALIGCLGGVTNSKAAHCCSSKMVFPPAMARRSDKDAQTVKELRKGLVCLWETRRPIRGGRTWAFQSATPDSVHTTRWDILQSSAANKQAPHPGCRDRRICTGLKLGGGRVQPDRHGRCVLTKLVYIRSFPCHGSPGLLSHLDRKPSSPIQQSLLFPKAAV